MTLPLFDFMLNDSGTAFANSSPLETRYLVMMNGISLIGELLSFDKGNKFVPDKYGRNYDLKPALAPISKYQGLQDKISVVSDLQIPFKYSGTPPAGGFSSGFHHTACAAHMTGSKSTRKSGKPVSSGMSSDQILREELGGGNLRHINVCVQPRRYGGNTPINHQNSMQFGKNGQFISPNVSPKTMYNELFSGVKGGGNAEEERLKSIELSKRKSVLDLIVRADARKNCGRKPKRSPDTGSILYSNSRV